MSDPWYDWLAMQQAIAPQQPNALNQIAQMQTALPEWAGGAGKNAGYQPSDIGSQASQLNYVQDLNMTSMDPLMAFLSGPGAYNPAMFDPTYQNEVVPAVTTGRDTLTKIVQQSPLSVEGGIAAAILEGKTAEQALQMAVDSGAITTPMKIDPKTGQPTFEPDTSTLDRYRQFADQSWQNLLSDQEETTKQTEIPNENLARIKAAGYSDPRETYTTDGLNPALQGQKDAMGQQRDLIKQFLAQSQKPSTDPYAKPKGVLDDINARMAQNGQTALNVNLAGAGPTRDAGVAPLDLGGQRAQARADRGSPGARHAQLAMRGKATQNKNAAYRQLDGMAATNMKDTAKTMAVQRFLQSQGRTPFIDEYTARLGALQSRGVGAMG